MSLSQSKQKDIERKNDKQWTISNDAAQAYHYLIVENDSLNSEIKALRELLAKTEAEKLAIINKALEGSKLIADQLKNQKDAKIEIDAENKNIKTYLRSLVTDSHLSGVLSTDILNPGTLSFTPFLSIPIQDKISIVVLPRFTQGQKPAYFAGLKYSLW